MAQRTSATSWWNLKTVPDLKRCILKEPLNKILRNTDSITSYCIKQSLAPLTSIHSKTSCLVWSFWLNAALSIVDIIFRVHSNVASGLSSSSTFTELITVDGYEERQVIEASTSLLLETVPQTCHQLAQMPHLALLPLTSYHALFMTDVTWTWPKKVITKCVWRQLAWATEVTCYKCKEENTKSYSMSYI